MSYFPESLDDWRKIALLIDRSERIFITTHINPDGDAIGSEIALAGFLSGMDKSIRIINHSITPEIFRFLDPEGIIEFCPDSIQNTTGPQKSDLVFFLDLGRYSRVGNNADFLAYTSSSKVIIDHHWSIDMIHIFP